MADYQASSEMQNTLQKSHIPQGVSAAELVAKDIPEPRWAVPGVIPAGLSFLAGRPKMGKSWLALNICIAVATGGDALGVKVEPGRAAYLALEDTARRLKSRLIKVLAGQPAPDSLQLFTTWPRTDQGGMDYLVNWLGKYNDCKVLVIDTFAKIRGRASRNEGLYSDDYAAAGQFKTIADKFGCSIILIHHTKKGGSADVFDEISGTTGLTGAADTIAILKRDRGQADAVLHITGRDVSEREIALHFNTDNCVFSVMGDASKFRLSHERQQILSLLKSRGALSGAEIAAITGKSKNAVYMTLSRMAADEVVKPVGGGKYLPLEKGFKF